MTGYGEGFLDVGVWDFPLIESLLDQMEAIADKIAALNASIIFTETD